MAPLVTKLVVAATLCGGLVVPFLGIYRDREWDEAHLFLKHRPSTRFVYSSPIGEGDRAPKPEEREDEEAYRDFVEVHRGYRRSIFLPFSSP